MATRQGRFIDHFAAVGIARLPLIIMGAIGALIPIAAWAESVLIALALPALVWYFALLYNGFRRAVGGQGPRVVAAFITGIVIAEVLSKIAVWYL